MSSVLFTLAAVSGAFTLLSWYQWSTDRNQITNTCDLVPDCMVWRTRMIGGAFVTVLAAAAGFSVANAKQKQNY